MLDQTKRPEDVLSEMHAYRETFQTQVAEVATELARRNKMNYQNVNAICARIDASIRDYFSFMQRINSFRAAHEAEAQDQNALVTIRREWGVASARTGLFRVELNQWSLMRDLVQTQVDSRKKRVRLYDRNRSELSKSQIATSDDVFDWVHAILNREEQTDDAAESGCFADIALPNSQFHEHLHAAYRVLLAMGKTQPMRFLDVGCGGGLKVLSALRYFQEADGLDFQQSYIDIAQEMLGRANTGVANAFQADALTFDDYGDYDVIYFFRPIRDQDKIVEMERRVVDQAKKGALLIAPYLGFEQRFESLGCGRIDGSLYIAKTSQRIAEQWRRSAEQTGVAVVHAEEERVSTIWSPLLEASRHSGYDVERFMEPV